MAKRELINEEAFHQCKIDIYNFLKEYDKFKKDSYHKIFYYTYLVKNKKSQEFMAMELNMNQSTISRKQRDIKNYILIKLTELDN